MKLPLDKIVINNRLAGGCGLRSSFHIFCLALAEKFPGLNLKHEVFAVVLDSDSAIRVYMQLGLKETCATSRLRNVRIPYSLASITSIKHGDTAIAGNHHNQFVE